jgi:SAM-dependent MidA family methyltransferase
VEAVRWEQAWQEALYGPTGFYRSPSGPAGHFATATHGATGVLLAEALSRLAEAGGLTHVVDVGAGRGELLTHLYAVSPALRLTGVDVVSRPDGLPPGAEWLQVPGGPTLPAGLRGLTDVLLLAHEWLDVVPCAVAEVDDGGGLRHRLVDPATGEETWGDPVDGDELVWADAHWTTRDVGDRVEVGLARDRAWADLVTRVERGVALAVDYGHRAGERPRSGTLTAYREGRVVPPVPDGSCDLTAHVAMDTLEHDDVVDQRSALRSLGVDGAPPPHDLARADPLGYLRALERSSAAAALTASGGFGDFLWAVKRVG